MWRRAPARVFRGTRVNRLRGAASGRRHRSSRGISRAAIRTSATRSSQSQTPAEKASASRRLPPSRARQKPGPCTRIVARTGAAGGPKACTLSPSTISSRPSRRRRSSRVETNRANTRGDGTCEAPSRIRSRPTASRRSRSLDATRLKSIPIFEEVGDEELAQIAPFAQEVSVEEGKVLVREGDYSYEFMAIEEGTAEVTRGGDHVADLGAGDFFGEMGLLEKALRNATVTAKTPMTLITLTGWDLRRVERTAPQAIERVRGDVLVTTVGPFARWGTPAAAAATTAGAHYLDSTGESAFIREVFERYGPAAERAGCGMLTAFGYDWVPGNLAGALALREGGDEAVRVDLGYFFTGQARPSGGTQATIVASLGKPGFAFRDGRVTSERAAKRVRSFAVRSKQRDAISVGSSEHFTLPRIAPQLREVNAYLGWFGPMSRPMQAFALGASLPGVSRLLKLAGERFVKGSTGGPDAEARKRSGSHIVAIAYDGAGRELAEVHLTGVDCYTFTGRVLAWGAQRAAEGGLQGTGALGPVDAFGLVALTDGCRWAGLQEPVATRGVSVDAPPKDGAPEAGSPETAAKGSGPKA